MINVTDKHNCCGCSACVQACPKQCISFEEDEKGFRYPQIDLTVCADCGLCEKVCPVLHAGEPRKPLKVYAAINPNEEIRMKSSSGGIFTMLAEAVIDEGGVVFGARFNDQWEVVHAFTETKEGLAPFRGSKYVQSIIGDCYKQAKQFLIEGRKVLFSGTSCQIAGLKNFLGKEYDNLLTVDVVCHGVPSPLVWRAYLKILKSSQKGNLDITDISFRDKATGWKKYCFIVRGKIYGQSQNLKIDNDEVLLREPFDKNLFMQVFLKNLCLRPSCTQCASKTGKCGSDLTIADFWGVKKFHPEMDDDKGTSVVFSFTSIGEYFVNFLAVKKIESMYDYAVSSNPSFERSVSESKYVSEFWHSFYQTKLQNVKFILNKIRPPFVCQIKNIVKEFFSFLKSIL